MSVSNHLQYCVLRVEELCIDIFFLSQFIHCIFFTQGFFKRKSQSAWRDLSSDRGSMPVRWNITLEMTKYLRSAHVSRVRRKLSIIEGEGLIFKSCPRPTLGTSCPVLGCEPFCVCPCTLQEAAGITHRYYPNIYQWPPVSVYSAPKSSLPCRKYQKSEIPSRTLRF